MIRMKPDRRNRESIEIASCRTRTVSPGGKAVHDSHTRHANSTDVSSKCRLSVSHTQTRISPACGTPDLGSPTARTSRPSPREDLMNRMVPSQPEYVQGLRSLLANDMGPSLDEHARADTDQRTDVTTSSDGDCTGGSRCRMCTIEQTRALEFLESRTASRFALASAGCDQGLKAVFVGNEP
jgi:hypothetical protein